MLTPGLYTMLLGAAFLPLRPLRRISTVAFAGGLISIIPVLTIAQQTIATRSTRVPVTVVLSDAGLAGGEPFLIRRLPHTAHNDLIILPADADVSQLTNAIRALITLRTVAGDTASANATIRMHPRGSAQPPPLLLPWAPRVLNDLQTSKRRIVPEIGSVRAVRIWLPIRRRGR